MLLKSSLGKTNINRAVHSSASQLASSVLIFLWRTVWKSAWKFQFKANRGIFQTGKKYWRRRRRFMDSRLIHVCTQSYMETRRKCELPLNSTRSVFGLSLIHHGSGADRFHSSLYVNTSTGSAVLCLLSTTLLQLQRSGPFRSRYARFLLLPDAGARCTNLAKFSTEQTWSLTPIEHHNIWFTVHNKTLTAAQKSRDSLVSPLQLSGSAAPWSTQNAAGGCWRTRERRANL